MSAQPIGWIDAHGVFKRNPLFQVVVTPTTCATDIPVYMDDAAIAALRERLGEA